MIISNILNLVIDQGSDFNNLTFQLVHKCLTRCPVMSSDGPSTIKIEPMGINLPVGSILMSGCDDLILSRPMGANDRIISVTKIPSSIPNQSIIQGPPLDITGWRVKSTIRDKTGLIIGEFLGVIDNPLQGKFKVNLPNSITSAIKANCTWVDYQGIDISKLGQPIESLGDVSKDYIKRFKKLVSVAYKWDVDTIDTQDFITRRVEGLALVSGEVTVNA